MMRIKITGCISVFFSLLMLMTMNTAVYAQQTEVSGVVTNAKTGEPISKVNIVIRGTNLGTTTNDDGYYSLQVPSLQNTLVFSYIGYQTEVVPIQGRTEINVQLQPSTVVAEELVVVGYGKVEQQSITGSISSVEGSKLSIASTDNVAQALQGKVSGVHVIYGSGEPGSSPSIVIHGVTSTLGTSPLIVIDGIPQPQSFSLKSIDADVIKSIDILKDAAAAAIYGARASNGVILINTKSGQEGPAIVTVEAKYGLQRITPIEVAGAREYAMAINQAKLNDRPNAVVIPFPNAKSFGHGTDWWNRIVREAAPTMDIGFGISGGSEDLSFYGNLSYYRRESQFKVGSWQRITGRLKVNYEINDKWQFRQMLSPQFFIDDDTPDLFSSVMRIDPLTQPLLPKFKREGLNRFSIYQRTRETAVYNPAGTLARVFSGNRRFRFASNTQILYNPISSLTVKTQFGFNLSRYISDNFSPKFYINPLERNPRSSISRGYYTRLNYVSNNTITYTNDFGAHSMEVLGGVSWESYRFNGLSATRYKLPPNAGNNPALRYIDLATGKDINASDGESLNRFFSVFGRFKYNYDERYYVTASIRRDVSSKFPADNQVAIFPAVSAGWIISNESFFQNVPFISFLKLRAGYGEVGNSSIPTSAALFAVGTGAYVYGRPQKPVITAYLSQLGNKGLQWETVKTYSAGINLKMFNNKLDISVEWYRRESVGNIYPTTLPLYAGSPSAVYQNVGNFLSYGWDISANYSGQSGNFSYSVGMVLSTNTSKVLQLAPGVEQIFAGSGPGGTDIKITRVGQQVGLFYGLVSLGIFDSMEEVRKYNSSNKSGRPVQIQPQAQPGDLKFKDINGDGEISYAGDATVIGNPFPNFRSGLNISLNYKRWSLRMQLYGVYGNDVYNTTKSYLTTVLGRLNFRNGLLNHVWTPSNKDARYPRLTLSDPNGNFTRSSSYFIDDGTYLRMKLFKLGYNIPIQSLRQMQVYVSAQNIFTLTNYPGIDPVANSGGGIINSYGIGNARYPQPTIFYIGMNLKF